VLVGFQVSAPDAGLPQPVLWPAGLTSGSGEYLNMTDVRVIVSSQDLFNKYLEFFSSQNTLLWTVSRCCTWPVKQAGALWCSKMQLWLKTACLSR
jgi:hypothetical protein